jgi:SAM-dependent methyltransferase
MGDVVHDVRNQDLARRLKFLRYVAKENSDVIETNLQLNVKTFFPFYDRDTFYAANRKALKLNMEGSVTLFKTDGLVFTDMGPYLRNRRPTCGCRQVKGKTCPQCRYWNPSLNRKYKPPELLTVDFWVKEEEDGKLALHSEGPEGKTVQFSGTDAYRIEPSQFQKEFYVGEELERVEPGKIYEFSWNKYSKFWVPLRVRTDRREANNIVVAETNWRLIHTDIPKAILVGNLKGKKVLNLMRKYHGRMKLDILSHWSHEIKVNLSKTGEKRRPRLFDIGTGYGGDVDRWRIAGYNVTALEPSAERLDELERRLAIFGMTQRVQRLEMGIEETSKILKKVGTVIKPADIVTSFHSMTLIYRDLDTVKAFIATLKGIIKPGGIFVCMAMDGAAIYEYMEGHRQLSMEGIKIQRSAADPRKIMVKMVTSDASLARGQTEFLVDFDHLISELEFEGFELITDRHLDTGTLLGDSELWWSQMTRVIEMRHVGTKDLTSYSKEMLTLGEKLSATISRTQVDVDAALNVDAKHFSHIGVADGQEFWLVGVLAGGSSFFHALLWAINRRYRDAKGDVNLRFDMVFKLRAELASLLPKESQDDKLAMEEYTVWCGSHLIPFISQQLDVNVHVLTRVTSTTLTGEGLSVGEKGKEEDEVREERGEQFVPLYDSKSLHREGRSNVILSCHENGRFEVLGRSERGMSGEAKFVFSSDDELIRNILQSVK